MLKLRAATERILEEVERKSGKPVQFLRNENLSVLASIQVVRNGADFHVLQYRPSNEPVDYFIAFQAGFLFRLFEIDHRERVAIAVGDAGTVELDH